MRNDYISTYDHFNRYAGALLKNKNKKVRLEQITTEIRPPFHIISVSISWYPLQVSICQRCYRTYGYYTTSHWNAKSHNAASLDGNQPQMKTLLKTLVNLNSTIEKL